MSDLKNKFTIAKDKVQGEIKETVGKATGNESLELKGKIQSGKADFERKTNFGNTADKIKDGISGKINDIIDKAKDNNKNGDSVP